MSLADLQQEAAALPPEERLRLAAFLRSLDPESTPPFSRADDPLFHPGRLMTGAGPVDVAARHDDYLYGDTAAGPRSGE